MIGNQRTKIWTDGGTKSNIPPFGSGYGSFRIEETGDIITEDYGIPMSSNAAEIFTMANAIKNCDSNRIELFSDSRIGLKWVKLCQEDSVVIPENISEQMKNAIKYLKQSIKGKNVKTSWRPRVQIFAIFGH